MTTPDVATRVEPELGVRDEVSLFGHDPRMFGVTHIPTDGADAGVVMCSSTHAELLKFYDEEALLARTLAGRGIAVQRFHYRGVGNSEGDDDDLSFDAMVEQAGEARDLLVAKSGVTKVGWMGVRLGAFPAVAAAAQQPGSAVAMWAPVVDTSAFIKDAFMSHFIAGLKGEDKPEKPADMKKRLEADGRIEVLGYTVTRRFHDSVVDHQLSDYALDGSVLVLPFGQPSIGELTQVWTDSGADVTELGGEKREAWWLDELATPDRVSRAQAIAHNTTEWFLSVLSNGAASTKDSSGQ